jgi:choline kinase
MIPPRALILAAGVGSRLMPLTRDLPKALVKVGDVPVLEGLLGACARAGIGEAVIVTGYLHDVIDDWLGRTALPLSTTTVFNEAYATRGNAWSVACARDALAGSDFVKFDGDLVFEPRLLLELLSQPPGSVVALDARADLDEEAMKATVTANLVTAMGKWLPSADAAGESIGIERIAEQDARWLFETIDGLMSEGKTDAYYEDAYHVMVRAGWRLAAWPIGALRWSEIDDAADLERARSLMAAMRPKRV